MFKLLGLIVLLPVLLIVIGILRKKLLNRPAKVSEQAAPFLKTESGLGGINSEQEERNIAAQIEYIIVQDKLNNNNITMQEARREILKIRMKQLQLQVIDGDKEN